MARHSSGVLLLFTCAFLIWSSVSAVVLQSIADNVWIYSTSFNFLGILPFNNNGMLVNTPQGIVAVGAPQLSQELFQEITDLTAELNTSVTHVLCTDWHHLYSADWGTNFTDATVYYTGIRGYRFHQDVQFKKAILDYNFPALPGLDNDTLQLIPIRGFRGPGAPFSRLPDETLRTEVAVLVTQSEAQVLYIFDFVLCTVLPFPRYAANFGPSFLVGFQTNITELAQETVDSFGTLVPDQLVFAHGDLYHGCGIQGADKVQSIIQAFILNTQL
eukprot:TRINITY_DN2498_c0_g1_i1.p1 TRINITY_DN2498_c0_g1~~TRINITY_DN2498_c0_g1_i1.p1  ORF type:complete len:273 (+),score=67.72 TRINITY_DN2498_c0_g1_i1:152-970(+)